MSVTETMRRKPAAPVKEQGAAKLRLLYTPGLRSLRDQRIYMLPVGRTLLGREPDNAAGIALPQDNRASRVHAFIEVSPTDLSVRIADQGSKNGTFINRGQLATQAGWQPLHDGDVLRIGDSFLILRHESQRPEDADIPALIGTAPLMATLRHRVAQLAADPASVLLLGETGSGKEVVSTALHQYSRRAGKRIAVNCSAIPESLAESQFFGHVANAFTGAKAHPGFFRAAHQGTLFLDEIGEIPLSLQPKLLRALEERTILPIGALESLPCDVRFVSATNRDLQQAMAAGQFREDLYARLAHVILPIPPLRARREDILPLLEHAGNKQELPPDVVESLLFYSWPRNVRELYKIADHLRLFGIDDALHERLREPPVVTPEPHSPPLGVNPEPAPPSAHQPSAVRPHSLTMPTKEQLAACMTKHAGVIDYVAKELGCSRRHVGRWLETYDLDRNLFRRR